MYRFFLYASCGLRAADWFKETNRMEGDCKFDFDVDIPTGGRYIKVIEKTYRRYARRNSGFIMQLYDTR